jgi:hypothetical protein
MAHVRTVVMLAQLWRLTYPVKMQRSVLQCAWR